MSLIHPWMLLGLGALAVPLVIHLLRSRRHRTAWLGTLRFLLEAVAETQRWRRLRNLLLLLLRVSAIVLLVLLFARPLLERKRADAGREAHVVLIDSSGSMDTRVLGRTAFARGLAKAKSLLAGLPEDAEITIAEFADDVRAVGSLAQLRKQVGGRTDYAGALDWGLERLADSDAEQKVLHIITDLQAAGLPTVARAALPDRVRIDLIPIHEIGPANGAITDVKLLNPYAAATFAIAVGTRFYGPLKHDTVRLQLELADGTEMEQAVDASGTTVLNVPFSGAPAGGRPVCGVVRLSVPDTYMRDNQRHFALHVRRTSPVLLLDGASGANLFEDEGYFLCHALSVSGLSHGHSRFTPKVVRQLVDPREYAAVAVCNVRKLAAEQTRGLRRYVEQGGSLLFFLGDRTEPESLAAWHRAGLLPCRAERLPVAVPRPIGEWDVDHPALRLFDGKRGSLSGVVFRESFKFELGPSVRVLARLANGAPAILEGTVGAGRILVYANPCDRDWADLPTRAIYVPLMRELFGYLVADTVPAAEVRLVLAGVHEARAPGLYGDGPTTVVLTDPRETDPAGADEEAFRDRLGLPAAVREPVAAEFGPLPRRRMRRRELWRFLALGLLVLSMLENLMAERTYA